MERFIVIFMKKSNQNIINVIHLILSLLFYKWKAFVSKLNNLPKFKSLGIEKNVFLD